MTPGANRSKQTQIYRLMQEGFDAGQISRKVKVYQDCVERFMEHFKTAKALPQTSAFAAIKEGMPRVRGMGRVAGLQHENAALLARIEALESQAGPVTEPAPVDEPITLDEGDDDGFG